MFHLTESSFVSHLWAQCKADSLQCKTCFSCRGKKLRSETLPAGLIHDKIGHKKLHYYTRFCSPADIVSQYKLWALKMASRLRACCSYCHVGILYMFGHTSFFWACSHKMVILLSGIFRTYGRTKFLLWYYGHYYYYSRHTFCMYPM